MTNTNRSRAATGAQDVVWPPLPLAEWQATKDTLQMWTQVVGKIRLAQTPLVNHWWNVPLYVTPRGLSTSAMPYDGERAFEMEFDFITHQLLIRCDDGASESVALKPRTVADFYRETCAALKRLNIEVNIWTTPVEVEHPIPFEQDEEHASYDADYAHRFWRILLQSERVLQQFRARFTGKVSPVHFFWGSFDLAVTRFSGKRAPERDGADAVTREAYSHEVISHGFWAGSGNILMPAFYAYAAPEPEGFKRATVQPAGAFYNPATSGYVLPYDAVREADDPDAALLEFLQSTYDAGATLAGWDRAALERNDAG